MAKVKVLQRRRLSCYSPLLSNKPPKIEEDYMEYTTQNKWHKNYVSACGAHNGFYQIKDGAFVVALLPDYFDIDKGKITKKENEANLLSAASELLESCHELMAMIEQGVPENEWEAIKAKAREAIAKATGA